MSNLALSLFQQVNGGNLGPYNPSASEWWAWAGAACFLVGVVGFSIMGLRATEEGRGHFAHKIHHSPRGDDQLHRLGLYAGGGKGR